ncbi:MAG: hypothetical protein K5908_09385 [Erysipelotrichaceae bacterium]|nr:hypothetical protein [Erysipelotrichaceae bacterium]
MIKKIRNILILAVLAVLLLCSCSAAKFDITSSSDSAKIKVNDVEDGTYAEISAIYVPGGKTVHIESSLSKGKLKIEFCEAVDISSAGESEEYVAGSILRTVEIGPGEDLDVSLDPERYVLQVTTIGQTDGTVQINVN